MSSFTASARLLTLTLLAAWAGCKPQPAPISGATATQPVLQATYVVIQKWEGGPANMELRVETIYVGNDGMAQRSTETVTDKVRSASAGQVDATELLRLVAATQWPQSSLGPASPEYSPAHVNVFWRTNTEVPGAWSGPSDGLPDVVQGVLSAADRLAARASLSRMTGQHFMRATRPAPGTIAEYRRAGLFHELSPAQLATAPLLDQALEWEQRLIPVPAEAKPYAVIGKEFQTGHSIEVLTERGAFQIRNLITQE